MHRRAISSALGSAALVLVCAMTAPVMAQTDEQRAGARSLATDGATAFNEGRFKDAVDLFSKAESLVHAPPHLLFIARANTKLGQLVKAREAYLKIGREQLSPNSPQAFRDAQAAASRELAAIEHKIGSLAVKVEGAPDAKDLQIDGNAIPSVLVGASQPIDPGEHHLEAVATGFRAQPKTIKVADGEKASVTIKLEVDPTAASPAMASTPGAPGAASPAAMTSPGAAPPPGMPAPTPDTGTGGGSAGMRIGAYSAFGLGAIGIGVGTVFLLKASSNRSKADDLCKLPPDNHCDPTRKAEIDGYDSDADSAQTLAIVGYAVGGAAVATGVLLLVLDKPSSEAKSAHITPWIGLGQAGVSGRF